MADDEKPEEGAEGTEESAAPKKTKSAGMMPLLLISLILAVVLGSVGFALAYFVVPARMAASYAAAAATPAGTNAAPADPSAATPTPEKEKTARTPAELQAEGGHAITKFTIEEVTVNIADTRGNRFVRAGVYFEAQAPVLEELEANRARMIDTVGQALSTKTLDQLTAANIRGVLREELLGIINPTLKSGRVDNLYFTDLLVQ